MSMRPRAVHAQVLTPSANGQLWTAGHRFQEVSMDILYRDFSEMLSIRPVLSSTRHFSELRMDGAGHPGRFISRWRVPTFGHAMRGRTMPIRRRGVHRVAARVDTCGLLRNSRFFCPSTGMSRTCVRHAHRSARAIPIAPAPGRPALGGLRFTPREQYFPATRQAGQGARFS